MATAPLLLLGAPASRENAGCCHCSHHGLLAYGAGGSVVIVDARSMQVLQLLPMPPPQSLPAAPYVTALSWLPNALPRSAVDFDLSAPHRMQLAAGDRHGRIALWDVGSAALSWLLLSGDDAKQQQQQQQEAAAAGGIQELCWVRAHPAWLLAAIHGAALLIIWDPSAKAPLWSYEATGGEVLTCLRRDPLDPRHLLLLASKALLLSLLVTGTATGQPDVLVRSYQHSSPTAADEAAAAAATGGTGGEQRSASVSAKDGAKDGAGVSGGSSSSSRCAFSSGARGIVYVVFPREIVVFDLNLGMPLCSLHIPRSCARLLDLVADVAGDLLLFSHLDGKLSCWKRKANSQVFGIAQVETLMPSIGNSVPPPTVLAVAYCPIGMPHATSGWTSQMEKQRQLEELTLPHALTLVSVSDDGRLWQWSMKYQPEHLIPAAADDNQPALALQLELTGQLHLLPSSVTTLAVSVPSLLATVSGGGNGAGAAVPLVALATQSGTVELVDPSANAVTSSFSIHNNSAVRGLRWLGNSRLVSFSYTEIKGKGGGFVNKLVLTCIRSGQSKPFRVLQKPERAPMRALRTSPSGRYMLILFREAPAEVWAMTKNPQMLRSLALPFTVMEWALPAAPKPQEASHLPSHRPSLAYMERPTIASTVAAANASPADDVSTDASADESAESFAFALVNGSLGVFELRGRRVRDFKPKWPVASFVSTDVLVTAMAYRMPHVVMGDRVGHLRWWDVISGASSSFSTHRGGIRRIKFAPVSTYDSTRGRVAVLFNDNTFGVYDLDTQDPVANAVSQPQLAGVLVVELDWFPLRLERQDPLLLCLVGADSSFRMVEFQPKLRGSKSSVTTWQRLRPVPVYSPALLPGPQALALRMLLQVGVSPMWFVASSAASASKVPMENTSDLRHYLLETNLPAIGDPVVLEVLLKALEPYRRTGRLLDTQSIRTYTALSNQGCAARLAFAAAHYGDHVEALFWLHLPKALALLSLVVPESTEEKSGSTLMQQDSERFSTKAVRAQTPSNNTAPFSAAVRAVAEERISWHTKLCGEEANQKIVHEHIAAGDFEAAVTLLLATPPESPHFFVDALRAVSLAGAVSPGLHELAIKVVAANMVSTEESLCGTHLLCAVGRFKEACSQLQDAGRWEDACTLAASKLTGLELARVLERWADHVLQFEHNIWKALTLLVAAGALSQALLALNAHFPDVAPFFLLACHEAKTGSNDLVSDQLDLPGNLPQHMQDVNAVCEFYTHYQHRVSHLCSGITF